MIIARFYVLKATLQNYASKQLALRQKILNFSFQLRSSLKGFIKVYDDFHFWFCLKFLHRRFIYCSADHLRAVPQKLTMLFIDWLCLHRVPTDGLIMVLLFFKIKKFVNAFKNYYTLPRWQESHAGNAFYLHDVALRTTVHVSLCVWAWFKTTCKPRIR